MSRNNVGIKIIAIACFVLLLWIGCASASTVVVSRTSPACTFGDGYFTSIQAAVDGAQEGDEIVVCQGTYKENIEVAKSLSIRTYGGATILEAKNTADNVITVTGNRVSISGFIIRNSEADGIYLDAVEGCNISRNNISSTRNGIRLFSSSNNTLIGNTANSNNYDGICIESSHNNYILNNNANYNKQSDGIELNSSNNNDIIGNNASNNMEDGVYLLLSNDNTIRGNRAYANKEYSGIELGSSNNNSIIDNNASDNFQSGIVLSNASNSNTILGNTANSNNNEGIYIENSHVNSILNNTANYNKQSDGVELHSSNNNDIIGNNASYNMEDGIYVYYSNNNTIRGNRAYANKEYSGIDLSASNNNKIIDNNASDNFHSGIGLFNESNNNTITENTANSNNNDGIYIETSHNNSILNNTANYNKQSDGIELNSSNNNDIIANNASNNLQDGIRLDGSNNNIIRGNTANSNKQYNGIELISSNNNSIIANNASNNHFQGISLMSSNGNTIFNNTLKSNGNNGIYLDDSSCNTIKNNKATNNLNYHGISVASNSNHNTIIGNNASNNFLYGIALFELSNSNTITDNTANSNNNDGIYIESSHNNSILNNTANANKQYHGIELITSNNNNIIANNASNNSQDGMRLDRSNNNTLRGNTAISNKQYHGIELDSSNNNNIIANNASNNFQEGIALNLCNNNTLIGNRANSNKRARGIVLTLSNNNIIMNNNASSNFNAGILLMNSNNNIIRRNIAKSNKYGEGIWLEGSNNNIVSYNTLLCNGAFGVKLDQSNDHNTITNNIIYFNSGGGIQLMQSQNSNISDNIINSNIGSGVFLGGGENNNIVNNIINSNQGRGLNIQWSRNNNVLDNIIESNGEYGIFLFNSNMITISGNLIGSNYLEGININMNYNSFNNSLYHNNIINNEARDDSLANRWYDDTLKEGNYWSDYNGTDDGSGTYKHAIAGDDIGDTNIPYPEEGYDFYPFMNRDGWLTMSVWPHYHDFGKVYQGTLINQTFTITNYANSPLVISSLLSEQAIISYDMEFPAVIPKGQSQSFNIMLDTEQLEGFILKNIEVVSNDRENPHKTIAIFGFVEIPASKIIISGVDYQSRVIKGQMNLFNVTIENQGDFRERNVSIEFKEGDRSLGSVTINNIEPNETKSAIFKWDTTDVAPKTYDITIEVKLKDKPLPITGLKVPVKVDMPSTAQTLIITNKERLADCWSAERAEKLENELIKLSYHVSVAGIPVYVEEGEAVTDSYQLWDSSTQDPEKANDVARHIKRLIDDKLKEYTGVKDIIIVGDDRIIPYYRISDNTDKPFGPESWYTEDDYTKLNTDSTVGSALRNNMFLTDNIYAADKPIEWKTAGVTIPELFIPSIPVSRLVETPDEISAIIDAFYRKEYVRPDKIFVTAHDFMWDSAWYCCSTLEEKTKTRPETIISRNNTQVTPDYFQNVKGDLLNTSNDIVLIFQHAEHYLFSVPKRRESGGILYTEITSRDICNSTADLNGAIVYSMSCHAGLNVPPSSSTNDFDLVQAFAQKGVVAYIAPTGFGIGSPRTRGAAHELLLSYFTRYLCEGIDAGTALMLAKQEYWATNYDFNYFDEQVLETTSLYGLPMVRINIPHSAKSYNESKMRIKSNVEEKPDTLVIRPTYALISTRDGDYYITPGGELLSDPRKPILPKEIRIFHPTPTRVLRGAVMTSAKYRIDEPFKPLIEYYQKSDLPLELPSGEMSSWFPARIFKINSISYPGRPAESRQYLIIITGQYKGPIGPGAKGKERMYDELSFDLYYTSGEETDPPVIEDVSSTKINGNATITVNAFDNESGIRRVLVTYTDINGMRGEWKSEDCKLKEGDLWTCSIPTEEEIEFFVQVVDNVGNVAINDNDGKYFKK